MVHFPMSPRTDAHFTATATATVYNVWPFKNMHTRALLQKPCTMSYGHLDTDTSVSSKAKIIICKYTPGGDKHLRIGQHPYKGILRHDHKPFLQNRHTIGVKSYLKEPFFHFLIP